MRKILLLLLVLISVTAIGQSHLKQGVKIGPDGDLVDSIQIEAGKVAIGVDGSDYTMANDDDVTDNATDIAAKIALDEMTRLTAIGSETNVADSDTVAVMVNGTELKVTRTNLLYLTNVIIGAQANLITALEDSIDGQRIDMQAMELINDYDSIRINDAKDKFYLYITDITGQYRATLNIDVIDDPTNPVVISMTVENAQPDDIIIVMSEYLEGADSSINRFSGSGGGVFSGMDAAYNFDESVGDLIDLIGTDDGTLTGATHGSTGIAGNAYLFDGNDKVDFGTGINYADHNLAGQAWLEPGSLSADFRIYSAPAGGFFIGYNASSGGLWAGIQGGALTSVTSIDLTIDAWNHVVWSYDQTANQITFWIDGAAEVESFSTEFTAVSDRLASSGTYSYYTGLMDDLFLWDSDTLWQERVDSLYNGGVGRRYNESGGGSLVFQDSIKDSFTISNADLGGTVYTVDSVFIENGNEVRLDLDSDIAYGELIRVSYDESANYGIRDTSDNRVASWSLYQITNNVDTTTTDNNTLVVKTFDYDGESLGLWSYAAAEAYYGIIEDQFDHGNTYIVMDTINDNISEALRISQVETYHGAETYAYIDTSMTAACLTFFTKLGKNFNSLNDGKISGLSTLKQIDSSMEPNIYGFLSKAQMKSGGSMDTYHFDHERYVGGISFSPYSYGYGYTYDEDYKTNFLTYGSWHKIDLYVCMNTYTDGVSDDNGVYEIALNDEIIFQLEGITNHIIEADTNQIQAINISSFWGGNSSVNTPSSTHYTYLDDFKVYVPLNDAVFGTNELHTTMWDSPNDAVTDDLYKDITITDANNDVTYTNDTGHENYRWLIDAGAGNKVTLNWTSGIVYDGSWLITYDGKETGDDIIQRFGGDSGTGDLSTVASSVSTGRYMYVYFTSDKDGNCAFDGDITFDQYVCAGIGNSLVDAPDEAYDLLGEETGYSMINLAVAGDKIEHQQEDWNAEVKISAAEKAALTHVIIAVGTNNAVTGTPDSATIVNLYKSLITDINADINASCKVVMFTMIHCLGHDWVSASDMVVLKAVNTWIETVPSGVDVVSTANTVDMSDGDNLDAAYDSGDGLHINAAGTAVFLQNLIDVIN